MRHFIFFIAILAITSFSGEVPLISKGKPCFTLEASSVPVLAGRLQRLCKKHYCAEFPTDEAALPVFSMAIVPEELSAMDYHIIGSSTGLQLSAGSEAALESCLNRFLAIAGHSQFAFPSKLDIKYSYATEKLDNSKLLPAYRGRGVATLEKSDAQGNLLSPDWLKSLVMVEVRLDKASIAGSLNNADALLDFYASMGVNALWITPIFERGPGGNGYGNVGLHRIEPRLTGTSDQKDAHEILRKFVAAAHKRNIYILFDVITWGTMRGSQLHEEHPDWYKGSAWGNDAFYWKSPQLQEWFVTEAVKLILDSDADGFRCDCEPNHAGEKIYSEIRRRLNDSGKAVVIMAEDGTMRGRAFDLEQDGVLDYSKMDRGMLFAKPVNFFADGLLNILDSCKSGKGLGPQALQKLPERCGTFRFYTNCISNHDYQTRNILCDRLKFNYAAIFAPFIPIWYCGDAFGHTAPHMVIYDQKVDFSVANQPPNAFFLEDVKAALAIRRRFPEIFEVFPLNHRDANIEAVDVKGGTGLPAYARFDGKRSILIIPNASAEDYSLVQIQLDRFKPRKATNLSTGDVIPIASRQPITVVIPPRGVSAILVE